MNKYIIPVIVGILMAGAANASLYSYFNQNLPSIADRTPLATECNIVPYSGTASQNVALEACLRLGDAGGIGATLPKVVALYEDSLAQKLSSTATSTFTLVRGTDNQSRAISGYFGFIIDEGTSAQEFFLATCSGTTCTINTRGIDVIDGKSNVAANQFEHRRGAVVKMTNYPQEAIMTRILNGDEALPNSLFWSSTSTAGIRYNGGRLQWSVDGFTSTYNFTSSTFTVLTASSTMGIIINSSQIGVNVSTTTGLSFGPDGKLYQKIQSSLIQDSTGIGVSTSSLVTGGVATVTPSIWLMPVATASGTIKETWIATSTSNNHQFLRSTSTGAYWSDLGINHYVSGTAHVRALDQSYQNTSTFSKLVTITVSVDSNATVDFYVSSTVNLLKVGTIGATGGTFSGYWPISFVVPPGWYYKTVTGGGTKGLYNWYEIEL